MPNDECKLILLVCVQLMDVQYYAWGKVINFQVCCQIRDVKLYIKFLGVR